MLLPIESCDMQQSTAQFPTRATSKTSCVRCSPYNDNKLLASDPLIVQYFYSVTLSHSIRKPMNRTESQLNYQLAFENCGLNDRIYRQDSTALFSKENEF